MATTEQTTAALQGDMASSGEAEPVDQSTIRVDNPATGAVVRTIDAVAPGEVRAMVARAREAQAGWEALGFEGRARVLRRAQRWVTDNAQRLSETIVSETGKTYEDAQLAEVAYAANAFGFWAKQAPKYLADEKVRSTNPFVAGKKLSVRYRPLGVIGIIGPWNYPLTNSFGDAIRPSPRATRSCSSRRRSPRSPRC
jgi:acyl-CoA reductase-like NAD-dependent aldehyde dehydrogenase